MCKIRIEYMYTHCDVTSYNMYSMRFTYVPGTMKISTTCSTVSRTKNEKNKNISLFFHHKL